MFFKNRFKEAQLEISELRDKVSFLQGELKSSKDRCNKLEIDYGTLLNKVRGQTDADLLVDVLKRVGIIRPDCKPYDPGAKNQLYGAQLGQMAGQSMGLC